METRCKPVVVGPVETLPPITSTMTYLEEIYYTERMRVRWEYSYELGEMVNTVLVPRTIPQTN